MSGYPSECPMCRTKFDSRARLAEVDLGTAASLLELEAKILRAAAESSAIKIFATSLSALSSAYKNGAFKIYRCEGIENFLMSFHLEHVILVDGHHHWFEIETLSVRNAEG